MPHDDDVQAVQKLNEACRLITDQLARVIVGQHQVIEELLVAMFARGHCLLVGVPGLAKTLMIRTLADSLSLQFSRIQFTPDLMPSDITGTEVIQEDRASGTRELRFLPGPIFANVVLADEINRTPPKTQAALLEAMQEHQLTVGGKRHTLSEPFFVLATQNPIEQEGTYPLPEAQLDRFMFSLWMDYPARAEERVIAAEADRIAHQSVRPVFGQADLMRCRAMIGQVPVSDHVIDHAVDLARGTRPEDATCPKTVRPYVSWGAGPRAAQHMLLGARCLCLLEGRPTPSAADVRRVAMPVLRHRLVLNYTATGENITAREIVTRLLAAVDEPKYD